MTNSLSTSIDAQDGECDGVGIAYCGQSDWNWFEF